MENLLYRRGYVLTNLSIQNRPGANVHHWNQHDFSDLSLYTDPDVHFISYKSQSVEIACIGIVLDPYHKWINEISILEKCVDTLKESSDIFWDYIDTLGGRFIILLKKEDQLIAFQDAVGTRSLFYYDDPSNQDILISSHSELIADLQKLHIDEEANIFLQKNDFKNNKNRYYPGLFTPYKRVLSLTPNTYLDVHTNKITRFFPRNNRSREQHISSINDVAQLLKKQLQLLNKHYDLAISLTGGLDSRLTLAASKEIKDSIYYYTLIYGNNHSSSIEDARAAKKLAETFNLDHHILQYDQPSDPGFIDQFKKNTSGVSSEYRAKIAEILYHRYPQNRLHIKSNIIDISKAHFKRRFAYLPKTCDPKIFSNLFYGDHNEPYVNRAMEYFIERTHLKNHTTYDYDLYDLFDWEHQRGKWQSLCLYEWDTVQDTVIIYNNRLILKYFISQSVTDRKRSTMHHRLVKMMWPELLDIEVGVNGTLSWNPIMRRVKGLSLRMKLLLRQ